MARAFALFLVVATASQLYAQTPTNGARDTSAVVATLADSDVTAAIALGQTRKNGKTFGFLGSADCSNIVDAMGGNTREYIVLAQGPYGRIVDGSAQAARKYMPFGPSDVSSSMRAPTLTVAVQQKLFNAQTTPVPVEHIVIRNAAQDGDSVHIVQPTHIEELPESYYNLMGAKIETKGVWATFEPKALPAGDLQFVVILSNKECNARLRERDRDKIR
ncbi:MAG TPA: hypothetical protein VF873_03895 [Gemmatimonadales bacterium]